MLNRRTSVWLRLSADATGIPGLRSYTLGLHAPREFEVLENFMNSKVADLLADLALWANQKKFDPPPEVLQYASQLEGEFLNKLNSALKRFEDTITSNLEKAIQPAIPKARVAAVNQLEKKRERYHWQTFMAFVRKNGKHKPPKSKKGVQECWNDEFAKLVIDAVWQCEPRLAQARKRLLELTQLALIEDTEAFKNEITNAKKGMPKVLLCSSINAKLRIIEHTFADIEKECNEHIESVLMDLCRDSEQNAFSRSMKSVYQLCAKDKNRKNITRRTYSNLEEHLTQATNKSPFELARKDIVSRVVRVHKESVGACIKPCLSKTLGRLRASLNELLDPSADDTELLAKKNMRAILPDLNSDLEGAKQDFEALKKKYEK